MPLSSQPDVTAVAVNHGPWAEVLENWITLQSNNSRAARVMKIDEKTVTVSKIASSNKRDVTETDLYLLGTIYKKFQRDRFISIVNIILLQLY